MPQFDVQVSITSAPTNVAVRIDNNKIAMLRDATGAFAGRAALDLPNPFPFAIGATGISGMKWSLEIKATPPAPATKPSADFKQDETFDSVIEAVHGTVTLA